MLISAVMEKPSVLYHASFKRDIEVFEPRNETVRDTDEGPQVFATPDKRLATAFMIPTNDTWANSGAFNGVPYLVVGDEEKFRNLDKGGAIYTLPSDTFNTDPTKGLGDMEWTSSEAVRPVAKEEYESALEAMLHIGVQVYFVDMATYRATQNAEDHGYSILKGLLSLNEHRNINPVSF
jgi:hypothetical protein